MEADGDDRVEGWFGEAVALVVCIVGHGLDIDDEEVLWCHETLSRRADDCSRASVHDVVDVVGRERTPFQPLNVP